MNSKQVHIGLVFLLLFVTSSTVMAGAKRNEKVFSVANEAGDTFQIWIKFGVGYKSNRKVNNVDVTVENRSLSDSVTVKTGKVKVATSYEEIAAEDFDKLLAAGKEMGKTHIIKNKTQDYLYAEIVVEVSIDFGGTTKYFIFWPGSNDKKIAEQSTPY
jgi:hypothetical protein